MDGINRSNRKRYNLHGAGGSEDIDGMDFSSIMNALDIEKPSNVKKLRSYLEDPIKNKNTYIKTSDGRYFELSSAINNLIESQFPEGIG